MRTARNYNACVCRAYIELLPVILVGLVSCHRMKITRHSPSHAAPPLVLGEQELMRCCNGQRMSCCKKCFRDKRSSAHGSKCLGCRRRRSALSSNCAVNVARGLQCRRCCSRLCGGSRGSQRLPTHVHSLAGRANPMRAGIGNH